MARGGTRGRPKNTQTDTSTSQTPQSQREDVDAVVVSVHLGNETVHLGNETVHPSHSAIVAAASIRGLVSSYASLVNADEVPRLILFKLL